MKKDKRMHQETRAGSARSDTKRLNGKEGAEATRNPASDPPLPGPDSTIFVAGHRGMVGSAIVRKLRGEGWRRIVTRNRSELDLLNQEAVRAFFRGREIDCVVLAAAKVGGIAANADRPADFIYQNMMIEANVIHESFMAGVRRLLFLGSSCIYPKHAPQPMIEEHLLSGRLEPSNAPYAIAKIAGLHLCESYNRQHGTRYRSVMPTNLYGPNDNYDLETSHVLPALIRKFHLARLAEMGDWEKIEMDRTLHGPIPGNICSDLLAIARCGGRDAFRAPCSPPPLGAAAGDHRAVPGVSLWGTGAPRREFLHVEDLAAACHFVMTMSDQEWRSVCETPPVSARTGQGREGDEAGAPNDNFPPVPSHVNVGAGTDLTIRELAEIVKKTVGYKGKVIWDESRPNGTPRKLLDISRLTRSGWKPEIDLKEGIKAVYEAYKAT